MAIKFVSIKCPECGATLDIEEGRKQIFCSYCGNKILIQNDNEYIYHHIDEAEMKRAETDQMVRLKQMEMEEKRRAANEKNMKLKIKISVILAVIGLLMTAFGSEVGLLLVVVAGFIWLFPEKNKHDDDFGDKVKVPSLSDFEKQSYAALEAKFRSAGFTNIKCIPLNDLRMGILKKPNMVESITINGYNTTCGGKKYLPDAVVVITYHSL